MDIISWSQTWRSKREKCNLGLQHRLRGEFVISHHLFMVGRSTHVWTRRRFCQLSGSVCWATCRDLQQCVGGLELVINGGFPQVWKRAYQLNHAHNAPLPLDSACDTPHAKKGNVVYIAALCVLALGSWWIISDFSADIKALLDFVTTVSFVSAPIYAWLNYKVMMGADVDAQYKPQGIFRIYTLCCLSVLTLFSVYYIFWKFVA